VFFLFSVLPGDPARMMLDKREDAEQMKIINQKYAFDRPLFDQYLLYINDVSPISVHHKSKNTFTSLLNNKYDYIKILSNKNYNLVLKFPYLRDSFVSTGTPVTSIISRTFKATFVLAISSIVFAIFFGIILGVISAVYKNSFADKIILFVSVLGMSLPSFFSAIIIAWVFGYLFNNYTGLNMTGSLYEVDDYGRGSFLQIKNLILPAITLGIRPLSVIIQLCRNSLLEVLSEDYIRTAFAKGLNNYIIIFKHAIKNALNPLITTISGWFASMLAGAVFVEYIFGWNGIGKEIVDALNKMDLPVVMGSVLFIAFIFVIINILVDIVYAWLDPRIRIN
tara:strand:- start:9676 stop:10686 length:1011 start_codon:yes stop_codon:yes gene_type:complete